MICLQKIKKYLFEHPGVSLASLWTVVVLFFIIEYSNKGFQGIWLAFISWIPVILSIEK